MVLEYVHAVRGGLAVCSQCESWFQTLLSRTFVSFSRKMILLVRSLWCSQSFLIPGNWFHSMWPSVAELLIAHSRGGRESSLPPSRRSGPFLPCQPPGLQDAQAAAGQGGGVTAALHAGQAAQEGPAAVLRQEEIVSRRAQSTTADRRLSGRPHALPSPLVTAGQD